MHIGLAQKYFRIWSNTDTTRLYSPPDNIQEHKMYFYYTWRIRYILHSPSHTVIFDENSRGQEINGQLHDTNLGLQLWVYIDELL